MNEPEIQHSTVDGVEVLFRSNFQVTARIILFLQMCITSVCVLPGRERGDELPLLGPGYSGRWDTVDLTWQNGVFTLNH